MPTALPRPRRVEKKRSLARTIFDLLFNGALIVSALILATVVLVREEQYAFGRPPQTIAQAAQQDATDVPGAIKRIPLSN